MEGLAHFTGLIGKPHLLIGSYGNWVVEGKHLSLLRLYGSDRGVPLTELHSADASKELLEVHL